MGVTIGCDAAKIGNNAHLLVIICVRLLQKIGLINLMNHTQFKKVNGYKIRTESVCNYWGICLMLHALSIYYEHINVDLLGV